MIRRHLVTGAAAASAIGAVMALTIAATPASAAEPTELLLSSDGSSFATTLHGGLFDELGLLIPGGSISSDFWVRNPTSSPASLRVSLRDVRAPSVAWTEAVTIFATDSEGTGTRTASLAVASDCDVLVPSRSIAAGGTIKVTIRAAMGDLQGTDGQGESAEVTGMVAMRDSAAGPFPESACEDEGVLISSPDEQSSARTAAPAGTGTRGSTGMMASTGSELPMPLLVFGGSLFGVGLFLLAAARRRSRDES